MTPSATSRWRARPILSAILSVTVLAIPLVGSVAAAVGMGHLLFRRGDVFELVLWWSAVLGASTLAFLILERMCRRLLPLAALLKMTMLFALSGSCSETPEGCLAGRFGARPRASLDGRGQSRAGGSGGRDPHAGGFAEST